MNIPVTVGTTIANRPPYRSVRAGLPHTAPTLDGWRRNARQGKDAGREDEVSIVRRLGEYASNSDGCAGCDGQAWPPQVAEPVAEAPQRPLVTRHSVITVIAFDHTFQPRPTTLTRSCIRSRSTALILRSVARIRLGWVVRRTTK